MSLYSSIRAPVTTAERSGMTSGAVGPIGAVVEGCDGAVACCEAGSLSVVVQAAKQATTMAPEEILSSMTGSGARMNPLRAINGMPTNQGIRARMRRNPIGFLVVKSRWV